MKQIDHMALRFNQAMIIGLLLLAFLLDQIWLVGFVAIVMLIGTIWPQAGLFKMVYAQALKPAGLLRPDMKMDDASPHLFAQGLGGLMLVLSCALLLAGASLAGWLLTGVVVALAAVNLFLRFCLGCFIFYQLDRRGMRPNLPRRRTA